MPAKILKFLGKSYQLEIRDAVDESVLAEIFKWREYRCADPAIAKAAVIIDAGAHIGLFSLYCRAQNTAAKIFALEPEPNNISVLSQNIKTNNLRVNIIPAALAGSSGSRRLVIASDNHNHRLAVTGEKTDGENISVKAVNITGLARSLKISRIDLLKLDVEGAEYEIFEKMTAAGFKKIKNLICEYHGEEKNRHRTIENRLRENGFSVSVFPSRFESGLGFILARNKRLNSKL